MSISYHVEGSGQVPAGAMSRRLILLILLNIGVAATVLFGWTMVSLFVLPPLEWATWMPVYRGSTFVELLRYPFVVLWLWPLLGVAGAWLAHKSGKRALAVACAALPVLLLMLVFGSYYILPAEWH